MSDQTYDFDRLDVEWPIPGEALYLDPGGVYRIGILVSGRDEPRRYVCSRPAGPRSWSRPWAVNPGTLPPYTYPKEPPNGK